MQKEDIGEKQLEDVRESRTSSSPEDSTRMTKDASVETGPTTANDNNERVTLTEADNRRIRRKTDKVILTILVWVYFLQILDKSVLGYGAVFGLQKDTRLSGSQYSFLGSIAPIAQLGWQPFSSFLIVKVPHRILMPALVLGWGIAQSSMAACHDYGSLLAARFFLGLFEAGCLPLFSVITSQWYRRSEQPIRVAAWYGTNGIATIVAAALSYGLGHIKSDVLLPWQIIFLFVGLITIATVPFIYWFLDNDIPTARFLTPYERSQALLRLRANNTGLITHRTFRPSHVLEACLLDSPKTILFISLTLLLNIGAQVSNVFGPLLLSGVGFDKYLTSLLNIPFGALQFLTILAGSLLAQKCKLKSLVLAAFMLPVIAGLAILYALPRDHAHIAPNLAGYYLFAFLFAGNPLIVAWIVANTAGTTKKSVVMSLYSAASAAGNIVGPYLFNTSDSPAYRPGLRAVLGIFVAEVVIAGLQLGNLIVLNRGQARRRVRNGKEGVIVDRSMEERYRDSEEGEGEGGVDEEGTGVGEQAIMSDVTDRKNDEFVYVY